LSDRRFEILAECSDGFSVLQSEQGG